MMTNVKTRGKFNFNVRDNNGLQADVLQQAIPSIFATAPHDSRSEKYVYIPTISIIQAMMKEGFVAVQAMQAKTRLEGNMDYAKHLIRFRRRDELGLAVPESSEIVLVNSHDGSSSYHLMNGVFRMVCENGLISGDLENNFKVRHTGNIIDDVIEAAYTVVGKSAETMDTIEVMKTIKLLPEERRLLADYSLRARYNLVDEESEYTTDKREATEAKEPPVTPEKVLTIKRLADKSDDLFTTMNIVQENLLKGGVSSRGKDGKRRSVRAVNGIDQGVKLNKLIWSFAEELKKIHNK